MIPKNHENRKARVNLNCPRCGINLADKRAIGFVREGETYCCQGCADGTGCACHKPAPEVRATLS